MNFWSDFIVGTGAAINLEIGFIPDAVRVTNLSDRNEIVIGVTNTVLAFDGGREELKEGDLIIGSGSKARGLVKKVLVATGAWSSDNATGFIVLEHEERHGEFADNDNLQVASQKGNYSEPAPAVSATVSAVVNGSQVPTDVAVAAAVGVAGANKTVAPYDGTSAGKGKGVTLGSAVIGDNKAAIVEAWRTGPS